MSVANLNSFPVIASIGVVTLASIPTLEKSFQRIPWGFIRWINAAFYALNVYATSRPGRFDDYLARQNGGMVVDSIDHWQNDGDRMAFIIGGRGSTLVAPAGWAFAIWGPIFVGEFLLTVAILSVDSKSSFVKPLRQIIPNYMVAQLAQALWAAAFRPKYANGVYIFLSAFLLSLIAFALHRAHRVFASISVGRGRYILYFLPMSLHFGWTSAASLVNLNGSLAIYLYKEYGNHPTWHPWQLWAGHGSVVLATLLGLIVTMKRKAPVYGMVIAWALTACASTMEERIVEGFPDDQLVRLPAIGVQSWLCRGGAAATALAAAFAIHARGISEALEKKTQ